MKLKEAIIFLLTNASHGMNTDQITREINEQGIYSRKDK